MLHLHAKNSYQDYTICRSISLEFKRIKMTHNINNIKRDKLSLFYFFYYFTNYAIIYLQLSQYFAETMTSFLMVIPCSVIMEQKWVEGYAERL